MAAGAGGGKMGQRRRLMVRRRRISFWGDENVLKLIVEMVALNVRKTTEWYTLNQ